MRDRAAFAIGLLAVALGALGVWAAYGVVQWALVSTVSPIILVVVGVGVLLLSRKRN